MLNGVMLQYFEWELPQRLRAMAQGRTGCAAAAAHGFYSRMAAARLQGQSAGINDVGYGVYDTYDLGEFDQKGTVRTKYGTRAEYLAAIRMLHLADLQGAARYRAQPSHGRG